MARQSNKTKKGRIGRRPAVLTLDTPHFSQTRAMCGPACLKIVCAYFGQTISEAKAAKACRASKVTGTTGRNLMQGARDLGFTGEIVECATFRHVERWLRAGVPVIVDWMSTVGSHPTQSSMACGHYSVVCGLDQQHITLQDPAVGRRRIARAAFFKVWFDFQSDYPRQRRDLLIRRMIVVRPRRGSRTQPSGGELESRGF
jgi:ABC-type bacteriocin/lantibiotic exporter with double-glycine peptidase domain